ncbi:MAG: FG-GAP repeat domain-containing protein, partial [Flavitalea sp.]
MDKMVVAVVLVFIIVSLLPFAGCNSRDDNIRNKNIQEGRQLAKTYCGSCHLLPEPESLNKLTWAEHVLPKMAGMLGFRRFASDYIVEYDTISGITLEQWKNIVRYYVTLAPKEPLKRSNTRIQMELPNFKVEVPSTNIKNPATTMVSINPGKKQIVFADGLTEQVYTFTAGYISDSTKVGIGVSNYRTADSISTALTMGVMYPSDSKSGKLISFGEENPVILIDSLQRPVHACYADLNGDALEDIVICQFGNSTGKLSWFEKKMVGTFTEHLLRKAPGSVKTEAYDFNKDGSPDIMALMAQGDEGFFIYYNQSNGTFKEERLLRLSPSYGSNYFELADFNKDGFPDIVASNGDNGDYPPIMKSYHGIRIYLNDGTSKFSEKTFLPVNGVGKVVARDFDFDGDLDLASISYFPDYTNTPEESF